MRPPGAADLVRLSAEAQRARWMCSRPIWLQQQMVQDTAAIGLKLGGSPPGRTVALMEGLGVEPAGDHPPS